MKRLHVIPVGNDEPIHTAGAGCACKPFIPEYGSDDPVTHNSFDKREQFERQGHVRPGNMWVIVAEEYDAKD